MGNIILRSLEHILSADIPLSDCSSVTALKNRSLNFRLVLPPGSISFLGLSFPAVALNPAEAHNLWQRINNSAESSWQLR